MERISIDESPTANKNSNKNNKYKKGKKEAGTIYSKKIKFEKEDSEKISNDTDFKDELAITQNDGNHVWNYKILLMLRKVGKKTMGYRWMHDQEAEYYEQMDTHIGIYEMIILAFMGTITGAGFINLVTSAGLDNSIIFNIIIQVIYLIIFFLMATVKGYRDINKYEKKKNSHFNAATKNAELNLNIQYQLSLNISDRDNDKIFLQNVIKSFNDILLLSPPIRNCTKLKYVEGAKDNDIFNPLISVGDNLQIIIHDDNNRIRNNENGNIEDDDNENIVAKTSDSKMSYEIDRWLQHF